MNNAQTIKNAYAIIENMEAMHETLAQNANNLNEFEKFEELSLDWPIAYAHDKVEEAMRNALKMDTLIDDIRKLSNDYFENLTLALISK